MKDHRVLSGMRPTGQMHLGHYHGVLKNWIELQNEYDSYYFVADWHAFTTHYADNIDLESNVSNMVVDWMATGINPNTSTIFVQSKVPEHAELHLLLSMSTPISWLERVPSFKDQQEKLQTKDLSTYGFLGYPLLQSADILVYKAGLVPVGEDQNQHLELCRDIAQKFNNDFNCDGFIIIPEPLIQKEFSRIMSLKDGTKKMSKSDPSSQSIISLNDDKENIVSKIKKAKTDTLSMPSPNEDLKKRPEVQNLLGIYSSLSNQTLEQSKKEFSGKNFSDFKEKLSDLLVEKISPIS